MKAFKKQFFKLIIFLFVVSVLPAFFNKGEDFDNEITFSEEIDADLEVHFIDVGQGDSCLIKFNDEAMLIDAGERVNSDKVIKFLKEHDVTELKYVVTTHPHSDHIGGISDVLDSFPVENIIMPEATSNSKTFEYLVNKIKEKQIKVIKALKGNEYSLGEADFVIVSPSDKPYDDLNNVSVVIKLNYKNSTFLFTGDIETLVESEIMESNFDIKSTVLKVAHHGSNSSSKEEFLQKVKPAISVISVGTDNSYGHPVPEIVDRISKYSEHIYRTDLNGDISIYSDGDTINVITYK